MKGTPKRKSYNTPGHAHELTFSTYQRTKVFANDSYCEIFLAILNDTRRQLDWEVWAYVIMPDHVHLLVFPKLREYQVSDFLRRLKHPVSLKVLGNLKHRNDPVLEKLSNGRGGHHLWQQGGGYDRDIHSTDAIKRSIDYIHNNPVVANHADISWGYKWSSASWYQDRSGPFEVDGVRM